jgi:hypothetical protein
VAPATAVPGATAPAGTTPAPGTTAAPAPQPALPPQFTPPANGAAWTRMGHVTLLVLDTITGRSQQLSGPVGATLRFESLTITAKGCYARPPTMRTDYTAWLDITDAHPGQKGFSGWLLAKEPAIASYDSLSYDVRLVSCTP